MKIVILDSYTAVSKGLSLDCLKELASELIIYERTMPEQVDDRIGDADAVIINRTVLNSQTLKKHQNLKYIGTFSTGYNTIDIEYCKQNNIVVSNVPGYSTNGVAQLTFTFILDFMFLLEKHNKEVHDGNWKENDDFCYYDPRIRELYSKTLGIIGYGNIAKQVARIALAFDMNILVYSRTRHPEDENDNLKFVDLDTLLKNSDIVSLHVPLSADTKELINEAAIEKMKNGAFLINTARGGLINEQAVSNALNSSKLAGAGLDVVTVEPILKDSSLLSAKNCIITPHIAWCAKETRARLIKIVADNLKGYINKKPQNNVAK